MQTALAQTDGKTIDDAYATNKSATSNMATGMEYDRNAVTISADSLCLPKINSFGCVEPRIFHPYSWRYTMPWDLHEGLNMNLGMSVFAQLGKHSYSGMGFTQDLSAMYVKPITNRLTIAAGGFLSNINWAHDSYRNAGLSAIVGYRFDDRWEAFVYGQKSIVSNHRIPYPLMDMQDLGDRIGASVRYNVNPSVSIELSVERRNTPSPMPYWGYEHDNR